MIPVLLAFAFVLAVIGALYGAWRLLGVDFAFVPAFVATLATLLVYFGGLAGRLELSARAVVGLGLAGFAWFAIDLVRGRWRPARPSGFWAAFVAGAAIFLAFLLGERLQHYDNFSHWAVMVKVMLSTGAYPTTADHLIEFTNYPPATATWIFLVCSFLGHSEGVMLAAQGALIFALFASLFGMISRKGVFLTFGILALGACVLSFFNVTIRINNLLVDFLLPLFVLAAWAVSKRYGGMLRQYVLLLPLLSTLLLVKSTGAIFCAFAVIGCAYANTRRDHEKRIGWPVSLLALAASAAALAGVYWSWQHRVATVFAGVANKFETNASSILSESAKTPEEVRAIVEEFLRRCLDPTSRPTIGLLGVNVLLLAVVVYFAVARRRRLGRLLATLALLDVMALAYYAGILAMYVYSMPQEEAAGLDGFDRYASSIVLLVVGGAAMALTREYEKGIVYEPSGHLHYTSPSAKSAYQKIVLACVVVCLTFLTSEYDGMRYNSAAYPTSIEATIRSVTGDRWYADGREDEKKYLFYGSDHDGLMTSNYFTYVSRYYMYAPNIDAIPAFYEDNLDHLLSQYDELVVIEPDAAEKAMLAKHYGITGEQGFYRIVEENGEIGLVAADR